MSAGSSIVHGGGGCRRPPVAEVGAGVPLAAAAEPGHDLEVSVFGGLADAVVSFLHLVSFVHTKQNTDVVCGAPLLC